MNYKNCFCGLLFAGLIISPTFADENVYIFADDGPKKQEIVPNMSAESVNAMRVVFSVERELCCNPKIWSLVFGKCIDYMTLCQRNLHKQGMLVQELSKLITSLHRLLRMVHAPIRGSLRFDFVDPSQTTGKKKRPSTRLLKGFNIQKKTAADVIGGSVVFEIAKKGNYDKEQWKKLFAVAYSFSQAWRLAAAEAKKDLVCACGDMVKVLYDLASSKTSISNKLHVGLKEIHSIDLVVGEK